MRIVKDGTRAAEIVKRIRLLFKKSTPRLEQVDVNEAIREMVVLLRSEATRYNIAVRAELSLNRMVGARGLSTTPRGVSFHLALPTKIEAKE